MRPSIHVTDWMGDADKMPEYRHPVNNHLLYKKTELEWIFNQVKRSTLARR